MRRSLIGTLLALGLIAGACGGSDPAATEAPTSAPATTAVTQAPTTLPQPSTTTAAPSTTEAPTTTEAATTTTTAAPTTTTVALTPAQAAFVDVLEAQGAAPTSGRAEIEIRMTGIEGVRAGAEVAFLMEMAFDSEAGVFSWSVDLSGLAELADPDDPEMQQFEELFGTGLDGLFSEIEVRQIGDTAYMKFPFFTMLFGVETDWISLPAEQADIAEGLTPVSPVNPSEFLASFGDVIPAVTEIGVETIRGVEVVHYAVEFDLEALLEAGGEEALDQLGDIATIPFETLPMDFWIADDGTIHRFEMRLDATGFDLPEGEGFETMSMRFDLFDHGADIIVEPPPADQVTDGEEMLGFFDV